MTNPLAGWRLPLRLAVRDIARYKGRSLLAGLLIFLPVFTLAAALTAISTFTLNGRERAELGFQGLTGVVSFTSPAPEQKLEPFPAAHRVVTYDAPPTAAEVSKQAGRPAVAVWHLEGDIEKTSGGAYFPRVFAASTFADLHSPVMSKLVSLVDGRLPSKPGEVAITDYGEILGLPRSGKISVNSYGTNPTVVTVVGRVRTPIPETALMGAPYPGHDAGTKPDFALGGTTPVGDSMIDTWRRYGAEVNTAETAVGPPSTEMAPARIALATATMGFISIVALLAGPAFAAGATRHRRTLGLFAANGATRAVLRRVVLAQALALGALTALAATTLGALAGAIGARLVRVHRYGFEPPVDIRWSWLVGIVVVSTLASLGAALVPARAASRTNLLQALRGQVSARVVPRRMPLIGLVMVALGCILLYRAVTLADVGADNVDHSDAQVFLVYVGVPLFFGGAVLAVPYVLRATGALAGRLPLTLRVAVRDVSRQRTRATAAVGAILAVVAVCTAAATFGASTDRYHAKDYVPSFPAGAGAFVASQGPESVVSSDAQTNSTMQQVRSIAPKATAWWATSDGVREGCSNKASTRDMAGALAIAIDDSGLSTLPLTDGQRTLLRNGGVLVLRSDPGATAATVGYGMELSAHAGKDGRVDVGTYTADQEGKITSCHSHSLAAAEAKTTTVTGGYAVGSGLLMTRSTLTSLGLHAPLSLISLPTAHGIDTRTEQQLRAVAPTGMDLEIERGYDSPVTKIIAALTAAFALVVLITTVVSTLLNDAESQADAATLATVGADRGLRRRITGAHAAALGFIGAAVGIIIGLVPGLVMARETTGRVWDASGSRSQPGTYVIPWWPLLVLLIAVPLVAAVISMLFARRTPPLTRREV